MIDKPQVSLSLSGILTWGFGKLDAWMRQIFQFPPTQISQNFVFPLFSEYVENLV